MDETPEPKAVCASTKGDKMESLMALNTSVIPRVPGTELTQMIVDTIAKTLQTNCKPL